MESYAGQWQMITESGAANDAKTNHESSDQ